MSIGQIEGGGRKRTTCRGDVLQLTVLYICRMVSWTVPYTWRVVSFDILGSTWQWWRSEVRLWGPLLLFLSRQDLAKVILSFCFLTTRLFYGIMYNISHKSLSFALNRGEKNSGEVALFTCTWTPGSMIHLSCCLYHLSPSSSKYKFPLVEAGYWR